MGRSVRKRRRVQTGGGADGDSEVSQSLPNGQNNGTTESDGDEEVVEVDAEKNEAVFHEPLHNLPDDATTLAALLSEASASIAGGLPRVDDPRRTLTLLRFCTPRLSTAQLADRLPGWCVFLTGVLRSPRLQWCREAACRTVDRLVTEAAKLDEAHRLLAGGVLQQLTTALVDCGDKAGTSSLNALHAVLFHFGRGCGSLGTQLWDHLFALFDSARPSVSSAACRCVALLPHTGPSGSAGAAFVAAWNAQVRGLVNCFHSHLDRLLDGIVEVQTFEIPEEPLERLPPALEETEPIQLRYRLARRLSALARCIQLMLSSGTQQVVSVPVTALLDAVVRCESAGAAAVTSAMEVQAARRCLDDVRTAALRLLERLITCCGASLLLRASAINRLLLNAVLMPAAGGERRTTEGATSTPVASGERRRMAAEGASPAACAAHCQALRTLCTWLRVTGAGSGIQTKAEDLVNCLAADVRPPEPVKVTLQTQASANGAASTSNAGNKRKRKPAADWLPPTVGGARYDPAGWHRRRAALEVQIQLVTSLGPLLKVSVHETLQRLCVSLLSEVPGSASPGPRAPPRRALYRLLVALVSDPHPSWPAPLQHAGRLLAAGCGDADPAISSVCQSGLAVVTRCLQPSHPSLFFPVDLSDFSKPPQTAESDVEADPARVESPVSGDVERTDEVEVLPTTTTEDPGVRDSDEGSVTLEVRDMSPDSSDESSSVATSKHPASRPSSASTSSKSAHSTSGTPTKTSTTPTRSTVTLSVGTRVTSGTTASVADDVKPPPAAAAAAAWEPAGAHPPPAEPSTSGCGGGGALVPTVDIADSDSSSAGEEEPDDVRPPADEIDLAEDEQGSVEMLDHAGFNVDENRGSRNATPDDDDDVTILESGGGAAGRDSDEEMAPDVAEMLKDFVPEDPEVE